MRPYIFSFRIRGVVVRAEPSWLFLALLVGWSLAAGFFPGFQQDFSPLTYAVMAVIGVAGLTFSIIAHELSHTFVGRAFGLPINHVTLFLFGGAAELEAEPDRPMVELVMALAGPLMSLFLAAVFALMGGTTAPVAPETPLSPVALVLGYLALINLLLAMFNMIPAFPLDGGRVLRAILWLFTGNRRRATQIASRAGEAFAWVFMGAGAALVLFAGALGGIWWILIGLFLRSAAVSARREQELRAALAHVPVSEIFDDAVPAAERGISVADFIDDFLVRYHRSWFPVTDAQGGLAGGAGVAEAQAVAPEARAGKRLSEIAVAPGPQDMIQASAPAGLAFAQMLHHHLDRLYVMEGDRLAGILRIGDLAEYARLRRLFDAN
jgi:Zn-dependent protease